MENMGDMNLLAGLLVVVTGHLTVFAYFYKPEEFYIKRFRPDPGRAVSHGELIFRAYVGIGLVHTSVQAVGFYLPNYGAPAWLWVVLALIMCPALGSVSYAYFRLSRYRKASPDERASGGWGDGVFVRRAPFGDELKTNWAKRVDRIARMVFAALAALVLTLIIAYGLLAG